MPSQPCVLKPPVFQKRLNTQQGLAVTGYAQNHGNRNEPCSEGWGGGKRCRSLEIPCINCATKFQTANLRVTLAPSSVTLTSGTNSLTTRSPTFSEPFLLLHETVSQWHCVPLKRLLSSSSFPIPQVSLPNTFIFPKKVRFTGLTTQRSPPFL